ncbi:MAG TPA: hypothetical protein VGD64_02725 [Acidisarcina sp.]
MELSNIDSVLFAASLAGQVILLLVLYKRKLYKEFPIFFVYVAYVLATDPLLILWMHLLHIPSAELASSPMYFRAFFTFKVPEYILGVGVLFEIGRNVLLPVRRSLPSGSLVLFGLLMLVGGGITYLLAAHSASGKLLTSMGGIYITVALTNAILRIACFMVIAIFAQMLGIGWKNHVVQLVTGLAFYGAVDLIVRMTHARLSSGANVGTYIIQFRLLDELRVISYLSTLTFWCWSFTRQEAPRKEFSPQMAGFLVSISGAVKRERSQFGR